jgi:crotonyl-CoA carboxylase/reductase
MTTRKVSAPGVVMADALPLGEAPPLGTVPERMMAQVIRPERYGPPSQAFQLEEIETPMPRAGEVLVYVMAAGVNFNNVWAALGDPVDVIAARNRAGEPEDFHIGGSDASGIVWAVGEGVDNVNVGSEVVLHCGMWDANDPWITDKGRHPMTSETARIWGYETNWGSFAQFTRVQAHQLLPKPTNLSWAEAACYMLVGATAYRMLCGWEPHTAEKDEVVLVWGASGGLGCQAIQIARARGAVPIAVVSNDERGEYCMKLGAEGYINRKLFDHWGALEDLNDNEAYAEWLQGARAFGKAIWDIVGKGNNPRIVFEHPGEATMPTSVFVCERGGMVVICAGTSGYKLTADDRYLWMHQKSVQGSHFANDQEAAALNEMVRSGQVKPCLSRTFGFEEIGLAHQLMRENKHPSGNMAVLVGATTPKQLV